MKFDQLLLPVLLLSVFAIRAGEAIKCYHCDSSSTPECVHFNPKLTKMEPLDCKTSFMRDEVGGWLKELTRIDLFETGEINVPMVCEKIIAENEVGESITYRSCQLDGAKTDTCVKLTSTAKTQSNIKILECSTCQEDACNTSTKLQLTNLWLFFVPLILLKVFV